MKVDVHAESKTKRILTISGDENDIKKIKNHTLELLQPKVDAPGFRKGKAPLTIVEKQLGDGVVQSEVLEEAINHLYSETIIEQNLRPLSQPKIDIKKFVPYTEIEFTAEIEIVPPVKLGDYKKIKKKREKISIKNNDIDEVIKNLRLRAAKKKEIQRPAQIGDEVIIDFSGTDKKGKAVAGASGKDYPLMIGSKTFIPGFEENVVGLNANDEKTFEVTFPKDYGHKPLASQKVNFSVKVKKVQEVILPELDSEFIKQLGPFDSIDSLKNDIRTQLMTQKMQEADDKMKDSIVEELVKTSQITIPEVLLQDQIEHMKTDFANDLTYRGITLKEYLSQINKSEEEWNDQDIKPNAEKRVKIGMVLSEVARAEQLEVSEEELDLRINIMKGQYQDQKLKDELDKPEQRRDISSRLLTEKTLNKLVEYSGS